MHATIDIRAYQFHATIGIRIDGVRSRLGALDEAEDFESMEFGGGIKMKKTTRKFRFILR